MSQPQTNTSSSINELDAALGYARQGILVFPTNPLDKKPLTTNGFKDATTDEAQIRAWWLKWPNAMIAAPTGVASGMWVVDLDLDPGKNIDGVATLAQLIAKHGEIPKTLMTITPRGGRHLVFAWDSAWDAARGDPCASVHNSAGRIGPGIDVRGEGGYVCLPPSRNANGGFYQRDSDGGEQAVAAPDWLIKLALKPKTGNQAWARTALDCECKMVAEAQPGTRNDTLNTAAFNLFQIVAGGGLDEQEVRDRLLEAAQTCGLVADDGTASVEATIDSAAKAARAQPRTRPQPQQAQAQAQQPQTRATIQILPGQLPRIVGEVENALLASGEPIFCRAGTLVEPISEIVPAADGRKTIRARLRVLCPDSLIYPVAEAAAFQRYDQRRNKWIEIDPPMQIVRMILTAERRWRFPRCNGIITTPTLRPDGSLLATPGYDPESQLYLLPGFQLPPIPEQPSKDEARAALKTLTDLFCECSFKAAEGEYEGRLNHSVALSGLLTALVRGSLPTAPIYLIAADTPGTGKSYLVDVVSMVATGRSCPVITASRSSDETEKRLGSILLDGSPIVSLDNCTHDLGGDLLCQLSERPVIRIRILGRSDMPECESHTTVFATGNNIGLKGDMVRRGFVCKFEALDERPELRTYQHSPLKAAAADRGAYVAAALTIIRAYLATGAP
jgi:hypothetical protein